MFCIFIFYTEIFVFETIYFCQKCLIRYPQLFGDSTSVLGDGFTMINWLWSLHQYLPSDCMTNKFVQNKFMFYRKSFYLN